MMPDGRTAHRLPPFEQPRSREFKIRTKNQFRNIRKPDKTAHTQNTLTRIMVDTNPLE
jgi:hypothetical protein